MTVADRRQSGVAISGGLLARNTFFNLLGHGLPLVIAVATVPFVVRGLGPERFGILALIWVVVGYSSVFDLGLGRATTKFVSEALASDDQERLRSIAWTAVMVQGCVGALGGLLLVAVSGILVSRVLNVPGELVPEAEESFRLVGLIIPAVLVTGSFRGVLEAAQRFDLVNAVRVPASATNFLLPFVGVLLGWGIPGIVLLLAAARWLILAVHFLLCIRVFPALASPARLRRKWLATLIGFGGWVTVSSIVIPLLEHLDRLMIGALLTVSAVAFYAIPYEMVTRLRILPTSLVSTLFPAFSALRTSAQRERVWLLFARSVKGIILVLGPVVLATIAGAEWLLRLWLGPEFARESTAVLQLLAVGVLVNSIAFVPYALVQAFGRPDLTAKFHVAELPVRVMLGWGLIQWGGVTGAALAWPIWATIDAVLLFGAVVWLGAVPASVFLVNSIARPLGFLLIIGGVLAVVGRFGPGGTGQDVFLACAFVALVGVMWRYSLSRRERDDLRELPARVRGRSVGSPGTRGSA